MALLVASLDADSGIGTWLRMRGELDGARARIAKVQGDIAALRVEVAALRDGGFAVERAIREQLGYARENETIVLLPGAASARSGFLEGASPPGQGGAR